MNAPQKRPYVKPRVGSTMLRSVWYLFAFAGVLIVAMMMPSTPGPSRSIEGGWSLVATAPVTDLPPGRYEMLVTGSRYALHYETQDPGGQAFGIEIGQLLERDGEILLEPMEVAYRDAGGNWSEQPGQARRLTLTLNEGRLRLTDDEGDALSGTALTAVAARP